jgi:hypothetical protein
MPMKKRERAQELPTGTAFAADGGFIASSVSANRLDGRRGQGRSGWDPYEVWRTRVKTASRAAQVPGEKSERGRLGLRGSASRQGERTGGGQTRCARSGGGVEQ